MSEESKFEQSFCRKAEKRGWICLKNSVTNKPGWPDRQFLKNGYSFFVEFKSSKGQLSDLQTARINQLRRSGFHVFVFKKK
jgi:hypothetical protein